MYFGAMTRRRGFAIASVFKNEADNIDEWLAHHMNEGVDHFFLFDLGSTDRTGQALSRFVKSGTVSVYSAPSLQSFRERQIAAYNLCLKGGGRKYKWLTFLDVDEFLFSPSGKTVHEVLNELSHLKAIFVPWVIFGSSHLSRPSDAGVVESFIRRTASIENPSLSRLKHDKICRQYGVQISGHPIQGKTILQPRYVKSMRIHWPGESHMRHLKNELGEPIDSSFLNSFKPAPSFELLRINHYWLRGTESPKTDPHATEWGSENSPGAVLAWDELANEVEDTYLRDRNRNLRPA